MRGADGVRERPRAPFCFKAGSVLPASQMPEKKKRKSRQGCAKTQPSAAAKRLHASREKEKAGGRVASTQRAAKQRASGMKACAELKKLSGPCQDNINPDKRHADDAEERAAVAGEADNEEVRAYPKP